MAKTRQSTINKKCLTENAANTSNPVEVLWKTMLSFLQSDTTWSMLIVNWVLAMLSGQMWNKIRHPDLFRKTQNEMRWIHASRKRQFVLETYFVLLMYGFIVFGMLLAIEAAESSNTKVTRRQITAFIGVVLMMIFFSLLLSIFKSKLHGYPYSLLFN